jgi:transposase
MEAYSLDLRERICAACDEGAETREEVAERFGVGRWFVQKLLRQRRDSGSIKPKPPGRGPAASMSRKDHQLLQTLVKQKPDATLSELCKLLQQAGGAVVKTWTMCRALKTLRLGLKKSRCTPANVTRIGFEHYAATSRNASLK